LLLQLTTDNWQRTKEELTMTDDELIELARQARERAYAPYSKFKVGAALLADDGRVFTGCNVENASYGLTICAERAAVFNAVSEGVRRFVKIAVVTDVDDPVSPCGACRQVLWEFTSDLVIIMANLNGKQHTRLISHLLPDPFDKSSL
jgi:cytidine deaminase